MIAPDQHLVLVGLMGSGKSTVARLIAERLDRPVLDSDDPLPIGGACAHVNLGVVSPDGRQVEPGETGELVIRGPSLMEGYWKLPERTAQALRPEPFGELLTDVAYHTGDLVRVRPDGAIEIIGRGDRRVKERGNLVDLDAIEQLETALESFAGTLLVVSHDRRFLDAVRTDRVIRVSAFD